MKTLDKLERIAGMTKDLLPESLGVIVRLSLPFNQVIDIINDLPRLEGGDKKSVIENIKCGGSVVLKSKDVTFSVSQIIVNPQLN